MTTEVWDAPWKRDHRLVRVGLHARPIDTGNLPPGNLVFLLDVSGSMEPDDKLPLLKKAFALLVDQLRPQDRVAIVVYAGAAGLVLPSTPGDRREKILAALGRLQAGGGTAGGAGLELAYATAFEHFMDDGNNRVILATDGDFNVGASSDAEMVRLIDDAKDAGELGAGHTVTALYEVVPAGVPVPRAEVDGLRYRPRPDDLPRSAFEGEMMYVKVRYKDPGGTGSKLLARAVADRPRPPSADFRFATAVAGFGMLLRDSKHAGDLTLGDVAGLAEKGRGNDVRGYRGEFIRLVEATRDLGLLRRKADGMR